MEYDNDIRLQKLVLDELDWDPSVNAADIGVSVRDSVVTLNGHVASFAEKRAAEEAALRVTGVAAVAEEIEVRLPGSDRLTDAEVAEAVVNAIKWHVYLPEGKLRVKVEEGVVTLYGEVDWKYQVGKAVDAVRSIRGVKGLINLIEVRPALKPHDIKRRIQRALERSALQEANNIEVTVHGHEVVLRGTAATWQEREDALRAASSAPGVTSVINEISIRSRVLA